MPGPGTCVYAITNHGMADMFKVYANLMCPTRSKCAAQQRRNSSPVPCNRVPGQCRFAVCDNGKFLSVLS